MTFPHCDDRVLHKSKECIYCDMYPDLQNQRIKEGINFTGHGDDPATDIRPLEKIYRWHGNIPMTKKLERQERKERAKFWKGLEKYDLC